MPVDLKGYRIVAEENGGYSVYQNGVLCSNTKAAMREIAALIGMQYDTNWTTRQFGARLLKAIGGDTLPANSQAPAADNAAAEKAKAEAEAANAKAAAEEAKAKAEKEKAKAEAEAANAKAAAEEAKAKAEKEKAKAEAEKAKAEAAIAAAKAAAEAAQAEAKKAQAAKAATATKTNNSKGALNGLFSVGENKKVRFSMGNLQFNAKKYEWRFAEHQYDTIGKDNEKIAPNYDGWIDLFGYGTSGYMGCQPFETSEVITQYPNQDIANTNYDWGVYNPITNGGNKEGLWRTLTYDEWKYLLKTRPNAQKLYIKACVNGVNGSLLLPDGFYDLRVRIPVDSTPSTFQDNSYDLTQWATLEAAGVVFLPRIAYRKGKVVFMGYNQYWSSSGIFCTYENKYFAYYSYVDGTGYGDLYFGRSVRLVQDVK